MSFADYSYRILSYIRHFFTARNTFGHGIHSPHLYYIVSFLIYDNNSYYCFDKIEKERERLLRANKQIYIEDFGVGNSGNRMLKHMASSSLMPSKDSKMLFRLINHLQPQIVVELGTNLGITTSYLSYATEKGKVFTFEGSKELLSQANKVWKTLKRENIIAIDGNIDGSLPKFIEQIDKIDFALIDANHSYEATKRYFYLLKKCCTENSVLVFDDIHYSRQMAKAWEQISTDESVTSSFDLYDMGIVFFNKQYLKKNYKLKI